MPYLCALAALREACLLPNSSPPPAVDIHSISDLAKSVFALNLRYLRINSFCLLRTHGHPRAYIVPSSEIPLITYAFWYDAPMVSLHCRGAVIG
jgi:hypothetical protein